jgi:hypothetical protein
MDGCMDGWDVVVVVVVVAVVVCEGVNKMAVDERKAKKKGKKKSHLYFYFVLHYPSFFCLSGGARTWVTVATTSFCSFLPRLTDKTVGLVQYSLTYSTVVQYSTVTPSLPRK